MPQAKASRWWHGLFGRPAAEAPAAQANAALYEWESPDKAIAFGHRIVFFGVLGFIAWAALAPLDAGVPAPGAVTVESGRKTIAPLNAGLIAQLNVTENQHVKEGDILLRLENTQPRAAHDSAVQQHFAMATRLARLEAEQRRESQLQLPESLRPLDSQAWAQSLLAAEIKLLTTRNEAYESEMAVLRERIAASEEKVRGARQQLSSRRQQHELLNEQVRGLAKLVEAGHTPRNQLLETQRLQVELGRLISELESAIAVSTNSVSELRMQQIQRRKEIQRDLELSLVEANRDMTVLGERVKATQDELERSVIKAPISGQIVALQGLAPGSTVSSGTPLMEIIPEGDRLLIDVQVATHLIDRIQPGLPADIRINAYPDEPQLVINGKVLSVSGDQLKHAATSQPYYLARLEVTAEGQSQLGQRKLKPGMPVEAIIKTGERSFIAYLLKPLLARLFTSFLEQ